MRISLPLLGVTLALVLLGCDNREFTAQSRRPFQAAPDGHGLSVTFWGTTSFLVETPRSRVVLDGYLSRPRHNLLRRIAPNPERITALLTAHGVCPSKKVGAAAMRRQQCSGAGHKPLDLVLPLHGHYDHAMDSAFIAGWTGARMLRSPSLDNMFRATAELAARSGYGFDGRVEDNIPVPDHLGPGQPPILLPDLSVRLWRTPHNDNPLSGLIADATDRDFRFPATIWRMGEGDSLAAVLTHDGRRLLFLGSAGHRRGGFDGVAADVVFLSLGGLGLMGETGRSAYWADVVEATGARRVFLTHWDDHQRPLPAPGAPLQATWFEPHSRVLAHLRALAGDRVEVQFLPTRIAIDPLAGL